MVTGIIGRKVGMTQVFLPDGTVVPATVIKADPCVVVQAKDTQTDGYQAVQIAAGAIDPRKVNQPASGHFKAAGVTPLAMGGAEYPAHQLMYQLALSKADRSWVNDYQLYKNKVDFKGPQWTYGAQTFADWVSKGYVDKNTTGLKAEDMGLSFIQGKAPIMVSGSWWYGRLVKEATGFQWGTFLFPGTKLHLGSAGNMWVVPSKAKAKKLAYDFIVSLANRGNTI